MMKKEKGDWIAQIEMEKKKRKKGKGLRLQFDQGIELTNDHVGSQALDRGDRAGSQNVFCMFCREKTIPSAAPAVLDRPCLFLQTIHLDVCYFCV